MLRFHKILSSSALFKIDDDKKIFLTSNGSVQWMSQCCYSSFQGLFFNFILICKCVLLCAFLKKYRTVYVHGITKQDFALWHSSIQLAAGTDGMALGNQQMNKNDVPIIVDSCIAFVTQYGKSFIFLWDQIICISFSSYQLFTFDHSPQVCVMRESTRRTVTRGVWPSSCRSLPRMLGLLSYELKSTG